MNPILTRILTFALTSVVIYAGIAGTLIVVGKPRKPHDPSKGLSFDELFFDTGSLPELKSFKARDGATLAYRHYPVDADTVLILLHGSGRHSSYLLPLAERKSRFTLFAKVESKRAQGVADAIVEMLAPYRDQTHTLTFDNGKEFADHERIADALEADTYFAHPYASWERGTNENTNGLLRQYFLESSDFSDATEPKVAWVHERLNTRPRKCLKFQMPETVFRESIGTCTC